MPGQWIKAGVPSDSVAEAVMYLVSTVLRYYLASKASYGCHGCLSSADGSTKLNYHLISELGTFQLSATT